MATDLPKPWADLLEALNLLAQHPSSDDPIVCEHDELTVNANVGAFTTEELDRLLALGFRPNLDWYSFYAFRGVD